MSTTLTLIDAGWEAVRSAARCGRRIEALNRLTRLLARPDVPASFAVEGHRLAGELALNVERYATARRHLKAAAKLDSTNAGTHYHAGRAWEEDPDGCDRRAAICFKKAAQLEGTNPLYRAAFGRAAARCGKVKLGIRAMLAAVELGAANVEVVRIAVNGLLEVNEVAEARQVIAKARFLCPNNSELLGLWERVKFEAARLAQKLGKAEKTRENARYAQDAHLATDGDRVTLPFVRLADGTKGTAGGTGAVRQDTASFPRPHLARLGARKADR
jgi:hypothetical protein